MKEKVWGTDVELWIEYEQGISKMCIEKNTYAEKLLLPL